MQATSGGVLNQIPDCYVTIAGDTFIMTSLPEISDSKSAAYNDEAIIGRSFPMKTFSHSENRSIGVTFHFYVVSQNDIPKNIAAMRAIQSACYPRDGQGGAPFIPPPVCQLKCGAMLGADELCVILRNYSVKFPTDVAWDEQYYCPYKFDVETTWEVVYESNDLPGQSRIFTSGM
jgi:hypothetical protein